MNVEINVTFTSGRKKVTYVTHDKIPQLQVELNLELDVKGFPDEISCTITDIDCWNRKSKTMTVYADSDDDLDEKMEAALRKDSRWKKVEEA